MATSKPLRISIHPSLRDAPWVAELQVKGHFIVSVAGGAWWDADLILGPNCARFVPGMEKYLDSFLAGARKLKYPGKPK